MDKVRRSRYAAQKKCRKNRLVVRPLVEVFPNLTRLKHIFKGGRSQDKVDGARTVFIKACY